MKNLEVAKLFERMADILALLEENAFKVIAFRKIARVIEELPQALGGGGGGGRKRAGEAAWNREKLRGEN